MPCAAEFTRVNHRSIWRKITGTTDTTIRHKLKLDASITQVRSGPGDYAFGGGGGAAGRVANHHRFFKRHESAANEDEEDIHLAIVVNTVPKSKNCAFGTKCVH
jgi:hypothetical protein